MKKTEWEHPGITRELAIELLTNRQQEIESKFGQARSSFKDEIQRPEAFPDKMDCVCLPLVNGHRVKTLDKCRINWQEAWQKAKDGTYGICLECKKPIPEGRLRSNPESLHCVSCKNKISMKKKRFI